MLELFRTPELVEQLLVGLRDGLSIVDTNGVTVFVNDSMCALTGYSREELVGTRAPFPYWPAEELETINEAFARTVAGAPTTFELHLRTRSGERFPALVSPSVLHGPDGAPVAYVTTFKDFRERKRLERMQAESEQRWRSIAENPFDFVLVIDREYRYVYVNHLAPGITLESLIGKATPFDFTGAKHHPAMRDAFETTFATGRATSYEAYSPPLDKWYSTIVGPIETEGRITSLSLLTRDITQQKHAEEALRASEHQLRESHKMETIGTLAGGIAHDINNILSPILVYSDLARQELAADHSLQPGLEAIHESAVTARDLVRRILLFSRRQEPQKQSIDLAACASEAVKLFRSTLPATIEIVLDVPAEPVWVLADRTQIDQVLANLVTNALQAMHGNGGTLGIRVRQAVGSLAAVVVTDSGVGMDDEAQRRAFDPFFTTKPTGTGTGLGLSIVHGIVREHGGDVTLQSAPGQGARFTVQLPVAEPPAGHRSESVRTEVKDVSGLRVLCVDDELAVANVVGRVLQRAGHTVTVVTSAPEALALFERTPSDFDLLVTDQTMPQMKGTALISAVLVVRPALPCMLMTGLDDEETIAQARALGVTEILSKPFSVEALEAAIGVAARSPSVQPVQAIAATTSSR